MSKRTIGLVGLVCFLVGLAVGHVSPLADAQGTKTKGPNWQHGLNLKCRKSDEENFSDKTKKWGIEVFKDENNGNLIYISEAGSIAVIPGKQ